jgi:aldehyde:ferredoxin oxidoreductase
MKGKKKNEPNQRQEIAKLSQEIHNQLSGNTATQETNQKPTSRRDLRKEKKVQKKQNKLNNYNQKRGFVRLHLFHILVTN